MKLPSKPAGKIKLAVVGGGPAALAAVYHLTRNEPDAYDITVYEMSWRLGGKTASGRAEDGRIEEHGLHVLFGSYHNVFRTMKDCYDQLRALRIVPPEKHSLQYFSDAIIPHDYGVVGDDRRASWPRFGQRAPTPDGPDGNPPDGGGGRAPAGTTGAGWERIDVSFPTNHGVPGDVPLPTLRDLMLTLFQASWMVAFGPWSTRHLQRGLPGLFGHRTRWTREDFSRSDWEGPAGEPAARRQLGGSVASRLLLRLAIDSLDVERLRGKLLCSALKQARGAWSAVGSLSAFDNGRFWSAGDFFIALARGIIVDRVLDRRVGFDSIDAEDFRVWLAKHGASERTLGSPWIRALYDAAFSYPLGGVYSDDPRAPASWPPGLSREGYYEDIGAGVAVRAFLTTFLTYKGSFYNKMVAGMGDVIHTPLYLVLQRRGVRFEFFHRLADAHAVQDAQGSYVVEELVFDTLPAAPLAYDPLVPHGGLLCWPSAPKLGELPSESHPRALEAESCLPSDAPRRLRRVARGKDFDAVLLGVPVAALPYSCPSLLALDARRPPRHEPSLWEQPEVVPTVRTVALQLWLAPSLAELGWPRPAPLLSLFRDPLNTWCDMTHLLPYEPWPSRARPGTIAYFCGPISHDAPFPAPGASAVEVAAYHASIDEQCAAAVDTCLDSLPELLPTTGDAHELNYSLLVDPANRRGRKRLAAQYYRINHEPQQCCTLALSGTTRRRMQADATGYANLFVTGDWTANGIYLACVEGAFQAGIRSARAIARSFGGPAEKYVIVAEELLGLQVASKSPKAPSPAAAVAAVPARDALGLRERTAWARAGALARALRGVARRFRGAHRSSRG